MRQKWNLVRQLNVTINCEIPLNNFRQYFEQNIPEQWRLEKRSQPELKIRLNLLYEQCHHKFTHLINLLTYFVVSMCQWIWQFRHLSWLRSGELTILVIFQLGYLTLHYFTVLRKSAESFSSGFTVTAIGSLSTLFISIHVCIRAPIGIDLWSMWSQRTRDKQQGRRVLEFPPHLHPHVKTPITHWFRSHNLISYTGKPLICRLR